MLSIAQADTDQLISIASREDLDIHLIPAFATPLLQTADCESETCMTRFSQLFKRSIPGERLTMHMLIDRDYAFK